MKYEYLTSSEFVGRPREEIPLRGIWDGLKESTSAHGIPHVEIARGSFKKSLWSIVSIGLLGCMIFYLYDVFTKFLAYNVNVSIVIQQKRELVFPAITMCNMNPLKRSALESGNQDLANLLLGNGDSKKRRKRALEIDCTSPNQIHVPSGLCFGLGTLTEVKYDKGNGAQKICSVHHRGGLAMPNTQHKWEFIRDSDIFNGILSTKYWIGIKKLKWSDEVSLDMSLFEAFASSTPDTECIVSDISDGHKWKDAGCDSQKYPPLCQQMIQCPWPVYSDPVSGNDICYFLFDNSLTMDYDEARGMCKAYDADAKAAILDTEAKVNHLAASGVFGSATETTYWMFLKNEKWEESIDTLWTNWASPAGDINKCGMGHTDSGHSWTGVDCSSPTALALCEWRDVYIPYVPWVPENLTTIEPSTVKSTGEQTAEQPTTEQPSTILPTTEQPSTAQPTTQKLPTIQPTTEPPSTVQPSTEQPSTVQPTSQQPSTMQPTAEQPSTIQLTTEKLSTVQPTTQPSSTDQRTTTQQLSTIQPTTEPTSTVQPSTEQLSTVQPTSQQPSTMQPTAEQPSTVQLTTEKLSTVRPTTQPSSTDQPTTTQQLSTIQPTTEPTSTVQPSTEQPSTVQPTSQQPSTMQPTAEQPSTIQLTTEKLSTVQPTTQPSSTDQPKTTQQPSTVQPIPEQPSTVQPTTEPPSTVQPTTTLISLTPTISTTTTLPPTTTPAPGATAPPPQSVPGSKFPERIQVRQDFQKEEKALEMLADMPEDEKASMGYSSNEFILDCQYNGYNCDPVSDFTQFYSGIHGNCFIFNSGWNETLPVQHCEKTGRRYGLKIIANIDQDEYTESLGEEAGVRLVLHPQDRMPFPEDEGILARPGLLTSIGVRKISVTRLPKPHGDCVRKDLEETNLTRNVYEEKFPVKYSKNSCLKTCYQYYVISECGCADHYYPKEGEAFPKPIVHSCDPSNITEDDCKYEVTRLYMQNQLDCDCPRSCYDEFYVPTVSSAQWPSLSQIERVKYSLMSKVPNIVGNKNDSLAYKRNLLKIEVYYEEFNYEKVTEKAAYGPFQFMSDIGGTLGLWLGFSLMTTFEFIEFGADLLVYGCLRLAGKGAGARGITDQGTPRRGPLHRRNRRKAAPAPIIEQSEGLQENRPLSGGDIELEDIEHHNDTDYPTSPPPPYASRNISPVTS